jgi:hypothetical protein
VPPLGSVRLTVVDHRGEPVLSRATVGLRGVVQPKFADQQTLALPARLVQPSAEKPPGSAPVVLAWQGVGGSVSAYARFPLDRQPVHAAAAPGPKTPSATADVQVPLRPDQLVVAGRFALADGTPIERLMRITRLGQGVDRTGRLDDAAIDRIYEVFVPMNVAFAL